MNANRAKVTGFLIFSSHDEEPEYWTVQIVTGKAFRSGDFAFDNKTIVEHVSYDEAKTTLDSFISAYRAGEPLPPIPTRRSPRLDKVVGVLPIPRGKVPGAL